MQSYRSVRIHDSAECPQCAPMGAGHMLCQHPGCDELAEVQHRRHATEAEYAALPEGLQPIDGVCHQAVFVCGDHEIPEFCDHTPPPLVEVPCPKCAADPGASCVKADGTVRRDHPQRTAANTPPPPETCTHAHREDCGGQGACQCTANDPAPDRPRRLQAPPEIAAPVGLTAPLSAGFADWCAERGVDITLLAGPVEPCLSQDNRPALRFTLNQRENDGILARDWHGRLVVETRVVPIERG